MQMQGVYQSVSLLIIEEILSMIDFEKITIPAMLPLLPLRDTVAFPGMAMPLLVGRERSIKAIASSIRSSKIIMMNAQRDSTVIDPRSEDIFETGTVGMILRTIGQRDGKIKVLVQGLRRAEILGYTRQKAFPEVTIRLSPDTATSMEDDKIQKLVRTFKEKLDETWSRGLKIPVDIMAVAENLEDPAKLSYLIAPNIGLEVVRAQQILEMADPIQRLMHIMDMLDQIEGA
jgi:ATP-dependent Lon protease